MYNLIKRCRNTDKEPYDNTTGIGSYDSDVSFFNNVSFALQFDRTGNSGFVTNACGTELSSMEFQQTIEQTLSKYRYKMIRGGMTDVMALKEIGAIANMANVECGYYNPHSADSYVYIPEMEKAMNLGFELIDKFGDWEFLPHHAEKEKWGGYSTPKIIPHVHEDSYCIDCYAPTAKTDSGMCHNCEQYYIEEYEMELKREAHGYNNW